MYVSILHYLTLFRVLSGILMHRMLWTTRRVCLVTIISYAVHMQFNLLSKRNNRHQIPNSFWFTLLESFVSMKHELIWALFCSNPVFQFVPSLSAWVAILPATATHPHVSNSHRLRCQVPELQAANVASSLLAHTIHLVGLIHKEILTHLTYKILEHANGWFLSYSSLRTKTKSINVWSHTIGYGQSEGLRLSKTACGPSTWAGCSL